MANNRKIFPAKKWGGRLTLIMAIALIMPLLLAAPAAAGPTPLTIAEPTDLTATSIGFHEITISWTGSQVASGFTIKCESGGSTINFSVPAGTYSYECTGLNAVTEYTFQVKALGSFPLADSDYCAPITVKTKNLPVPVAKLGTPTNLQAITASSSVVNITWNDTSNGEESFVIQRKTGSGAFQQVGTAAANAQNYSDTGLASGTAYTYRIYAKAPTGFFKKDSSFSNEASTTTTISSNPPSSSQTVLRFYIGSNEYYLNDQLKTMDAAALIMEGRTMLPIAYAATPLGVAVDWNGPERKVTLSKQGTIIELWIDQSTARINGTEVYIDPANPNVAPRIVDSRTMLPIGFIALNLNCGVDWNPGTHEVKVSYPK